MPIVAVIYITMWDTKIATKGRLKWSMFCYLDEATILDTYALQHIEVQHNNIMPGHNI